MSGGLKMASGGPRIGSLSWIAECWLLATASGASVGTPGGAPRFSAQPFAIDHQEIERDQDRRGLPFGRPQREEVAGRVWPKHHRLSIEHDTLLILDRHRSRHFVKSCQRASCHFVNSAPRRGVRVSVVTEPINPMTFEYATALPVASRGVGVGVFEWRR